MNEKIQTSDSESQRLRCRVSGAFTLKEIQDRAAKEASRSNLRIVEGEDKE